MVKTNSTHSSQLRIIYLWSPDSVWVFPGTPNSTPVGQQMRVWKCNSYSTLPASIVTSYFSRS